MGISLLCQTRNIGSAAGVELIVIYLRLLAFLLAIGGTHAAGAYALVVCASALARNMDDFTLNSCRSGRMGA